MPPFGHPALTEGRTIYPTTVRAGRDRWALKSGNNAKKIGSEILKGKWKNFPVFTLTLEERRTCPTTCHHWRSCFGNKMDLADRVASGPDLIWRLEREVALLEMRHPTGFAVRLHVLGDFFSVEYVQFWHTLLERHPALHVFGFTARWDAANDPIAAALVALVKQQWDRFAIRFSNAPSPFAAPATISIEHPYQKPSAAILCPEQVGKTESCSTCGLCWASTRRIAFLQH
jgi:hypothetical protein